MSEAEVCACTPACAPASPRAEGPSADAAFKALASQPRRALMRIVAAGTSDDGRSNVDVCACTLSEALGLAPSTISHHMAALVNAGLVSATKRGLWVYYRLERDALARVAEELTSL